MRRVEVKHFVTDDHFLTILVISIKGYGKMVIFPCKKWPQKWPL